MQPKRNTPSVFDLSLADYPTSGASICCRRDETTFTFTIGPVPDATAAALDGVAHEHGKVRLRCRGQPLLFDLVSLERQDPNKIRIVVRRVDAGIMAQSRT